MFTSLDVGTNSPEQSEAGHFGVSLHLTIHFCLANHFWISIVAVNSVNGLPYNRPFVWPSVRQRNTAQSRWDVPDFYVADCASYVGQVLIAGRRGMRMSSCTWSLGLALNDVYFSKIDFKEPLACVHLRNGNRIGRQCFFRMLRQPTVH